MRYDWIKERLDELGESQKSLGEHMNLPPSRISEMIKGDRQILAREVLDLSSFLRLPAIVILRRLFPQRSHSFQSSTESDNEPSPPQPDLPVVFNGALTPGHHDIGGAEFVAIGFYDARLSAGPGSIIDPSPAPDGYALFQAHWLRAITATAPDRLAVVRIDGDSMIDTLLDGDHVLIDRSQTRFSREGIYAMRVGEDCWVKRLSLNFRDRLIQVISDNTRYPIKEMPEDDIELIGRVVMIVARKL